MLFGKMLLRLKEQLRPKTGNPLRFFYRFVFSYVNLLVKNVVLLLQRITANRLFSRVVICKCCEDACCVGSRISYGPKQGFPWHFLKSFIYVYVYLFVMTIFILQIIVYALNLGMESFE